MKLTTTLEDIDKNCNTKENVSVRFMIELMLFLLIVFSFQGCSNKNDNTEFDNSIYVPVQVPDGIEIILKCWIEPISEADYYEAIDTIEIYSLNEQNYESVARIVKKAVNLHNLDIKLKNKDDVELDYLSKMEFTNTGIHVYLYNYDGRSLNALDKLNQIDYLQVTSSDGAYPQKDNTVLLSNLVLPKVNSLKLEGVTINENSGIGSLTNVKNIDMNYCEINGFGACENLQVLESLKIYEGNVISLQGLEEVPNKIELNLSVDINDENIIGQINNMPIAKLIVLPDVKFLSKMQNIERLSVDTFDDIPGEMMEQIKELQNLKELSIRCANLENYQSIQDMKQLQALTLNIDNQVDATVYSGLSELKCLDIAGQKINDISWLTNMPNLTELDLAATKVSDISILKDFTQLEKLDVSDTDVSDISVIKQMPELKYLKISETKVKDISSIASTPKLETLIAAESEICDISQIVKCKQLECLDISSTAISDINGLKDLNNLRELHIGDNDINDIAILSELSELEKLSIYNTKVIELSALEKLNNLNWVSVSNCDIKDMSPIYHVYWVNW